MVPSCEMKLIFSCSLPVCRNTIACSLFINSAFCDFAELCLLKIWKLLCSLWYFLCRKSHRLQIKTVLLFPFQSVHFVFFLAFGRQRGPPARRCVGVVNTQVFSSLSQGKRSIFPIKPISSRFSIRSLRPFEGVLYCY